MHRGVGDLVEKFFIGYKEGDGGCRLDDDQDGAAKEGLDYSWGAHELNRPLSDCNHDAVLPSEVIHRTKAIH